MLDNSLTKKIEIISNIAIQISLLKRSYSPVSPLRNRTESISPFIKGG